MTPHEFRGTERVPGWCVRCGQASFTAVHLRPGDRVRVEDNWGPTGVGAVVELDFTNHEAVLVHLDGNDVAQWVLGPHVIRDEREAL